MGMSLLCSQCSCCCSLYPCSLARHIPSCSFIFVCHRGIAARAKTFHLMHCPNDQKLDKGSGHKHKISMHTVRQGCQFSWKFDWSVEANWNTNTSQPQEHQNTYNEVRLCWLLHRIYNPLSWRFAGTRVRRRERSKITSSRGTPTYTTSMGPVNI